MQKKSDDRNGNISRRIQQNVGTDETVQPRAAVVNPSTVTNRRNSAGILVQQNSVVEMLLVRISGIMMMKIQLAQIKLLWPFLISWYTKTV